MTKTLVAAAVAGALLLFGFGWLWALAAGVAFYFFGDSLLALVGIGKSAAPAADAVAA